MRLQSPFPAREHSLIDSHRLMSNGVPPMRFNGGPCSSGKAVTVSRTLSKARHMTCKLGGISWILDEDSTDIMSDPLCRTSFTSGDNRKATRHCFGNDHAECVIGRWED